MKPIIFRKVKGGLRRVKRRLSNNGVTATATAQPCRYNVDSPVRPTLDQKRVTVEGWLIPNKGAELHGLRAMLGHTAHTVPYGLKRADVAKAFPQEPGALDSGFMLELDVRHDGRLSLEADFGKGYKELFAIELSYAPERLVADLYNPNMAANWAEHLNLIDNKTRYFYEEATTEHYDRAEGDPRLVAFYLPQFHPIPENDRAWGKGFTEWTNVTNDRPRFVGHQQPILPRDTGFYDLRFEQTMRDQIALAKQHGIYGFCFYYYWFSGKRLLEEPLDNFVRHTEWDFNFSICWANENWTKRWDGRESEVILAQKYLSGDPLHFIKDVEHILLDPRYIQEDGKPVLVVFRASELKDPAEYARVWREYFKAQHGKELHLVSIVSFEDKDPRSYGFDAALDFAPQSAFFKNDCFEDGRYPYLNVNDQLLDNNFEGSVADYRKVALNKKSYAYFDFPIYKCATPSWDNDARKKGKGFVMYNQSPDVYGQWLDSLLALEMARTKNPLVFLNAWNEWAEGAVLEPTQHYGHTVLNRTTEVLARYSGDKANQRHFPLYGVHKKRGATLAVVLHLYYPDTWPVIREKLAVLTGVPYDLYVTLTEKDRDFKEEIAQSHPDAQVSVVPNRGRDVLPFVHLARRLAQHDYQYVLKLHTKKSKHRDDGGEWFAQLLDSLLPNETIVRKVLATLDERRTIVGPHGHYVSLERYMGADEPYVRAILRQLLGGQKTTRVLDHPGRYGYFGGTMFWAHMDAIRPLLSLHLMPEDFASEQGQIDGTFAHGVERAVSVLPQAEGKPMYSVSTHGVRKLTAADIQIDYPFAP